MNDTDPPRVGAARLRTLNLRVGMIFTALLTLCAVVGASLPALASAHARRPADARHSGRRVAVRLGFVRRRTLIVTSRGADGLAVDPRGRRPRAPRHCVDSHVRIGRAPRLRRQRATQSRLNPQRKRSGLPPLQLSHRLNRSAQSWTNTMVRDHSFSHGSDFGSRISGAGFDWAQIGENIADGYRTPAGAVKAWMASTGHCENILNPDFREVGAGFDMGSAMGGGHGTWTTDFGLRMGQAARSSAWGPAEGCPY